MHEMSLAEGVLQIIEDSAKEQNFSRVKSVWLEIGQLSSVEPEAMRFCFDAVVKGSLADGAKLEIVIVDGGGQCMNCGQMVRIEQVHDACPACGGFPVEPTAGTDMRITELEVE